MTRYAATRLSPAAMLRAGWQRVDPAPRRALGARWRHVVGWTLAHCGHPTALWPWDLHGPDGRRHVGFNGKAWDSLASAVGYVLAGAPSADYLDGAERRATAPWSHGVRGPDGAQLSGWKAVP